MISFEYPLAALLPLVFAVCGVFCRMKPRAIYFPNAGALSRLTRARALNLKFIFKWLTIFALSAALASPVIYDETQDETNKGIDIVLAFDLSGSMQDPFSEDLVFFYGAGVPSKFEVSRAIIKDFISRRTNDNIAIVGFGRYGFLICPLTYDKALALKILESVAIKPSFSGGTAIGEGVARSVQQLLGSKAKTKIIVLVTDGLEEGSVKITMAQAGEMAAAENIKVYTVAIGQRGRKDLQDLAQKTGAQSFNAARAQDLQQIYAKIDALEKSEIKAGEYKRKTPYFYYPLFVAFISALLFTVLLRKSL